MQPQDCARDSLFCVNTSRDAWVMMLPVLVSISVWQFVN